MYSNDSLGSGGNSLSVTELFNILFHYIVGMKVKNQGYNKFSFFEGWFNFFKQVSKYLIEIHGNYSNFD